MPRVDTATEQPSEVGTRAPVHCSAGRALSSWMRRSGSAKRAAAARLRTSSGLRRCGAPGVKGDVPRIGCARLTRELFADTNVVAEWTKPRPNPGVIEWLVRWMRTRFSQRGDLCGAAPWRRPTAERPSTMTARCSAAKRPRAAFRGPHRVDRWAIADEWGRLMARREAHGRPMPAMDALIAATAQVHALTLVTRNARDLEGAVNSVVNPWR